MVKLIFIFLSYKSPVLSAWLSFLLPGGGQFYTKCYLKGAVIASTETYLIHEFKRIYDLKKENRISDTVYERKILYNGIIYLMVHIYSIADAYISAHFYNFPKDTTLNLSFLIEEESFKLFLRKKF